MAYEKNFAIRNLAINASTWTDVVSSAVIPFECNSVFVFNNSGVNVSLRTDPNNANSQIPIAPGQSYDILGSVGPGTRFSPMDPNPLCALLSTSGNVNVIIESVR